MTIEKEQLIKVLDTLCLYGEKYKNDADFRQKIDSNTLDLKEEFGLNTDTEVEFKVNSVDTHYFVINEDANIALSEENQLSNINGAKSGDSNTTFEQAQGQIAVDGIAVVSTGLLSWIPGLILWDYATRVKQYHPEYFHKDTLVIKSSEEYYANN